MNAFSTYHPILLVIYIITAIFFVVATLHPIVMVISLLGAISYYAALKGTLKTLKELTYYSFLSLLIFLSYSTFVHNGYTPLFFLNDQPITFEAIAKGVVIAISVTAISFYVKSYFPLQLEFLRQFQQVFLQQFRQVN